MDEDKIREVHVRNFNATYHKLLRQKCFVDAAWHMERRFIEITQNRLTKVRYEPAKVRELLPDLELSEKVSHLNSDIGYYIKMDFIALCLDLAEYLLAQPDIVTVTDKEVIYNGFRLMTIDPEGNTKSILDEFHTSHTLDRGHNLRRPLSWAIMRVSEGLYGMYG